MEFLLRVAFEVQKKLGPKHWLFVGMPEYLSLTVEQQVKELGLEEIETIPHTSWLQLPEIICRGKIGVNFHKLGEAHTEVAIPTKIFEYLACGLPTVSTSLPLVVELLSDVAAVKLIDDKLCNFTEAVIGFLTDPNLAQKSAIARECACKKYSWKSQEKKLLELYNDIL